MSNTLAKIESFANEICPAVVQDVSLAFAPELQAMSTQDQDLLGRLVGYAIGNATGRCYQRFSVVRLKAFLGWYALSILAGVMTGVSCGAGWGVFVWFASIGAGSVLLESR